MSKQSPRYDQMLEPSGTHQRYLEQHARLFVRDGGSPVDHLLWAIIWSIVGLIASPIRAVEATDRFTAWRDIRRPALNRDAHTVQMKYRQSIGRTFHIRPELEDSEGDGPPG